MKNNKPRLYSAIQRLEIPQPWKRLHDMTPDPRAFRLPPKQAAEIRRRQLDAMQEKIRDQQEGYILAGQTLRNFYIRKWSMPGIVARAAERQAVLDDLESFYTDER